MDHLKSENFEGTQKVIVIIYAEQLKMWQCPLKYFLTLAFQAYYWQISYGRLWFFQGYSNDLG